MPCQDVTELIQVAVDAADRLAGYRFIKRTCGQGVGLEALLLPQLEGRAVDDILAMDPAAFGETYPAAEDIEVFLALKHLVAVQSALEVLTGRASGGANEICAAAEIAYDDGRVTVEARIAVDLVTEKIRACGGCKSCGKSRAAAPPVFA